MTYRVSIRCSCGFWRDQEVSRREDAQSIRDEWENEHARCGTRSIYTGHSEAGGVVMKGEWISVKDRLPRKGGSSKTATYVLVVDVKGRMAVAYYDKHPGYAIGFRWVSAKPTGEITHWMPLPEPPS